MENVEWFETEGKACRKRSGVTPVAELPTADQAALYRAVHEYFQKNGPAKLREISEVLAIEGLPETFLSSYVNPFGPMNFAPVHEESLDGSDLQPEGHDGLDRPKHEDL